MKTTIEEWVAALRGGDYSQGQQALQRDGCFCCLGVLYDLEKPEGWVKLKGGSYGTIEGSRALIPVNLVPRAIQNMLAVANDGDTGFKNYVPPEFHPARIKGEPLTFEEIARWIEKNYAACVEAMEND